MPLLTGLARVNVYGLFKEQIYDATQDFGIIGDLVTVFDGACSTGAPTKITSVSGAFTTQSYVGQRITLAGAGASGVVYVGNITAIDSTTQVTISPSISTTVSNRGLQWGTDNTAGITLMQTVINSALFPGATVMFGHSPTNSYGFPIGLIFNKTVQIRGIGGGHTCDSGDYTRIGGTRLAWWGNSSDGGNAFSGFITFAPTSVQSLKRVALRSCWLDCRNGDQNQALYGVKLASCHGWMIDDFFVMDGRAIGLWTDIDSDPTEAKDTTRFMMQNACFRQLDNPPAPAPMTTPILMTSAVVLTTTPQSLTVAANTLPAAGYLWTATTAGNPILVRYTGGGGTTTLTGCTIASEFVVHTPTTVNGGNVVESCPGNATAMMFNGGSGANSCCGVLHMVQVSHGTTWGPAGIELCNADSIVFEQVMQNGGSATADGAINRIRKPGVRLNGSIVSATLASRNNVFEDGDPGVGGVSVMGVNNAGARLLAQAGPNYWDRYQVGNGAPVPTVEGNAYFDWHPNGGWRAGQRGSSSVADQAISAATLTQITGSLIAVPPQGFQIGTVLKWTIALTSGAAGTAAGNIFRVKLGTAGTTADADVAVFTTQTAGTAALSEVVVTILLTIRTIGGTASATGECTVLNAGATGTAVGFIAALAQVLAGTMTAFNTTVAQQFLSATITTSTGKTATIKQVTAEVINPANP